MCVILRPLSTDNERISLVRGHKICLPVADDARRARVNETLRAKLLRHLHKLLGTLNVDCMHDGFRGVESRARSVKDYFGFHLLEDSAKRVIVCQVRKVVSDVVDGLGRAPDINRMKCCSFRCRELPEDLTC